MKFQYLTQGVGKSGIALSFLMQPFTDLLYDHHALLITAPPGWGKTYKLLNLIKKSQKKFLFVFPLRALCQEVYLSSLKKNISVICLGNKEDRELISKREFKLIISTPEMALGKKFRDRIIILDEFHLFFYWGESFRSKLLDFMEEQLYLAPPLLLLSATMSLENIEKTNALLELQNYDFARIDYGNRQLKNHPNKVFYYPKWLRSWMDFDIFYSKRRGTSLVFCKYRNEVRELAIALRGRGYRTLSCVGGEATQFSQQLQEKGKVDFIVATTVVSHGVNLPCIEKIYLTYNVHNLDYYLQMVGRGGRGGSGYELYTLDRHLVGSTILLKILPLLILKRLSHRFQSLLYYAYEA